MFLERAGGGSQDGAAELYYPFHYVLGRFQHQKLLAGRQSYDGIRRNFDVFDQVGVDNKWDVVQPGELYHELLQSVGSPVYRRASKKRLCYSALSASDGPNDKVFACVSRSKEYRIFRIMEPNWTKVDFKNPSGRLTAPEDRLRNVHEALTRDLSISLSAFLRSSVTGSYAGCREVLFSEAMQDPAPSCFGLALVRPQHCRLLLQVEYSVLFPIVGIALGAKPGSFLSPERKPTEIEFQVVNLLFRLLLSDAYRAWAVPLKGPLETVTLEVEERPARTFAATDPVLVTSFGLSMGEHTGQFSLIAPAMLFAGVLAQDDAASAPQPESPGSPHAIIELMQPANVSLDVWLDGARMRLGDLLQLAEGQIVKLDHPVERKAVCTLNGKAGFTGQIVSTGARRAFMLEDFAG